VSSTGPSVDTTTKNERFPTAFMFELTTLEDDARFEVTDRDHTAKARRPIGSRP
jgi:hypothetical protein